MQLTGKARATRRHAQKKNIRGSYKTNIPVEQRNQHELDPKELNTSSPNRSTEQQTVVPCKDSHEVMKT